MRLKSLSLVALVVVTSACNKSEPAAPTAPPAQPITVAAGQGAGVPHPIARDGADATPPPIAPRAPGPVGDALDAYDTMRLALAHDDGDRAIKAAAQVASSAQAAAAAASGATKGPLAELAKASEAMAKATDIASARAAFSDVTKSTVASLVADPSLQTGRFLFMCPMAKGYQKWVQTTSKLENPFYGKEMLDCGEQQKAWTM